MINFKWGIMPAVFAMIISVLLGAASGAGISHIILRALAFSLVFFGLGVGMWFIVNSYFPEILADDGESAQQEAYEKPGSRVNLTVDNSGEYAVPELYKTSGRPDELGNIEDLVSGAFKVRSESVDRTQEDSYNEDRARGDPDPENIDFQDMFQDTAGGFDKSFEDKPVFTPSFADNSGELGGLPDLDDMAVAFSSFGDSGGSPAVQSGGSKGSSSGFSGASNDYDGTDSFSHNKGNKPQPMKGDFDPQEIAQGIRTMLNKDK